MFMVIGVVNVHLFRTDLNNSLPLGSYLGKITGRYILFLSPKHLFFQCRNEKNLRELGEQSLVWYLSLALPNKRRATQTMSHSHQQNMLS